jgi:hypothetical protein
MDQTTSPVTPASSNSPSKPARTIAAAEVPGLLAELEASGEPLAQFARERGIAKCRPEIHRLPIHRYCSAHEPDPVAVVDPSIRVPQIERLNRIAV